MKFVITGSPARARAGLRALREQARAVDREQCELAIVPRQAQLFLAEKGANWSPEQELALARRTISVGGGGDSALASAPCAPTTFPSASRSKQRAGADRGADPRQDQTEISSTVDALMSPLMRPACAPGRRGARGNARSSAATAHEEADPARAASSWTTKAMTESLAAKAAPRW